MAQILSGDPRLTGALSGQGYGPLAPSAYVPDFSEADPAALNLTPQNPMAVNYLEALHQALPEAAARARVSQFQLGTPQPGLIHDVGYGYGGPLGGAVANMLQPPRTGPEAAMMFGMPGVGMMKGPVKLPNLPMDHANRMARAKELGFSDTPYYHATDQDVSAFDLNFASTGSNAGAKKERAIFLTSSPKVAETYVSPGFYTPDGKTVERTYTPGANIMPLHVRDLDKFEHWDMSGGAYKPAFMRDALKEAKKAGAPGVVFHDMRDPGIGSTGQPTPSDIVAVFDPKLLRSPAARFDPKSRNKRDILAGIAGLTGGAGAALALQPQQQKPGT